mgnify:CR=1 FL=1
MKRALIFLPAILILCVRLHGQSEFRPGVIMAGSNDSVTGLIDYRNDIQNTLQCRFKADSVNSRIYRPFEIYGYRFTSGKFYISKYIRKKEKTEPFFVEFLVKGKKNLYYMRDESGGHFLIDYHQDTLTEVRYKVDHFHENGYDGIGESKIHQGYLKTYFNDCPSLSKDIERIQVPDINNMVSLTKKYNYLTCGDSGCIVFYKKPYRFRVDVEFRFGMIQYWEYSKSFKPQYSGLAHFWIPHSNERMYLVAGFAYSELVNYNIKYSIYKVPLKFEYRFPYKVIVPRFEGGVNFMTIGDKYGLGILGLNFPMSAGVMIYPGQFIGLNLGVEGEFFQLTAWDEFRTNDVLFAYSIFAGICIRF